MDAAGWIAEASGIPKFIIGATIVSFATTLPEMLVSVFAALEGNADIAVGNAVGSVTANTGLIMCLSLVCMTCLMERRQFGVKACLLLAAILSLFGFTRDGRLSVAEGLLVLVIFAGFLAESLISARREQGTELKEDEERPAVSGKTVAGNIVKFVLGAAGIVLGAQLLIDNGSAIASLLGVPDAIIEDIADRLAELVDFFSIGTNDLTQYTLAIDRQNERLDDFYNPHHEAILRMIQMVVENAHKCGKWAGICGELGADPTLTEQFVRMGVDELSVAPSMILKLRKIVREMKAEA